MNVVIDNDWPQTSMKFWWRSIDALAVIVNDAAPTMDWFILFFFNFGLVFEQIVKYRTIVWQDIEGHLNIRPELWQLDKSSDLSTTWIPDAKKVWYAYESGFQGIGEKHYLYVKEGTL